MLTCLIHIAKLKVNNGSIQSSSLKYESAQPLHSTHEWIQSFIHPCMPQYIYSLFRESSTIH